jgi:hypothetical protein
MSKPPAYGDLTGEQRVGLVEIVDRSRVHRTLTSKIDIVTTLA